MTTKQEALEELDKLTHAAQLTIGSHAAFDIAEKVRPLINSVPEWRPIEEAPKDGTMILVLLPRMMNLVVRARYNTVHGYWLHDYEGEGGVKNYFSLHKGDLFMSLPQPPKETQ